MLKKVNWLFIILTVIAFTISSLAFGDVFFDRAQLATPPVIEVQPSKSSISLSFSASDGQVSLQSIQPATANQLAIAMDIPTVNILSASFGSSDTSAAGVQQGSLGHYFPTNGGSFAILATGLAATAESPDDSGSTSTVLNGLNNEQGNDLVQVTLNLSVPSGATCFGFDFAYYSEEFPEWVGSIFNDAFTAELGGTDLHIINDQVVAPLNFTFDSEGNSISVNTVFGVSANTGTTYDGVTPLLKAISPIDPGATSVEIVLSIQDLGDSIYDSAVFMDNFFWGSGANCSPGAFVDSDGDALLDDWETNGIDIDNDGTVDLDLPAMGADPNHKDIFVEIDYMNDPGFCLPIIGCFGNHSHKPRSEALQLVIEAFANAPVDNPDGTQGINIHIDAGADSIMNPLTNTPWGSRSESSELQHDNLLGFTSGPWQYNWSEFDSIRSTHFSVSRRDVFHYSIFAHDLGGLVGMSGIARGIPASDFIVSLGSWTNDTGTRDEQAGTSIHELGHTLGLRHGGDDHANYEPNYLSVMNYSFQTRGLRIGGLDANFDYSRFALPNLDENHLNESVGLNGGVSINNYGTRYYCGTAEQIVNNSNNPINWNCNTSSTEADISSDINNSGDQSVLGSYNDWDNIIFNGGAIGKLGDIYDPPMETTVDELTKEENDLIATDYAVAVDGHGTLDVCLGYEGIYTITIKNMGEFPDTYSLVANSEQGWVDTSPIASEIQLSSGEDVSFELSVNVPSSASEGDQDFLNVISVSHANPYLLDSSEVTITVVEDYCPPTVNVTIPSAGAAVQDGVTLTAEASDISGVASVFFYVREPGDTTGIPIGQENLAGILAGGTSEDGEWEHSFDTTLLQDGYYVILAKAVDTHGNESWSEVVNFSIRNWAVVELLPSSESNKAGRTMPIKFSLRIAESVDPSMPFVYNEELEIRVYKTSNPGNIMQTSHYGDSSKNYRIDSVGEKYITNFKTTKKPAEYTVEIWRMNKNWMVGDFTFETVK